MASDEFKSIVAENCPNYDPSSNVRRLSMLTIGVSCHNCGNFIEGKCNLNYSDNIEDMLKNN